MSLFLKALDNIKVLIFGVFKELLEIKTVPDNAMLEFNNENNKENENPPLSPKSDTSDRPKTATLKNAANKVTAFTRPNTAATKKKKNLDYGPVTPFEEDQRTNTQVPIENIKSDAQKKRDKENTQAVEEHFEENEKKAEQEVIKAQNKLKKAEETLKKTPNNDKLKLEVSQAKLDLDKANKNLKKSTNSVKKFRGGSKFTLKI